MSRVYIYIATDLCVLAFLCVRNPSPSGPFAIGDSKHPSLTDEHCKYQYAYVPACVWRGI